MNAEKRYNGYKLGSLEQFSMVKTMLDCSNATTPYPYCRVAYTRLGDPNLPVVYPIAGYLQSVVPKTAWYMEQCLLNSPNSVIATERLGIGTSGPRPEKLGRSTIGDQRLDAERIFEESYASGLIEEQQKVILVGHSLGGDLAGYLVQRFPERIHSVVLIAPIPAEPYALLRGGILEKGALQAIPNGVRSLWTGKPGCCPEKTIRRLFCDPLATEEEVQRYLTTLQPDSGMTFTQALLGYGLFWGRELVHARRAGWQGSIHYMYFSRDQIIPRAASLRHAALCEAETWEETDEAHCWFMHQSPETVRTAAAFCRTFTAAGVTL